MSDLDQEIGKRLRDARKLRGYKSARVFAIEQKIPESTYSQHETGKRSLNPQTVLRYCGCLDIQPGWLLSGKGSMELGSDSSRAPEATLKTSLRQTSAPQTSSTNPVEMTDNLVLMNMDILKGVIRKALHTYFFQDAGKVNIDEFMAYCIRAYHSLAAGTSSACADSAVK